MSDHIHTPPERRPDADEPDEVEGQSQGPQDEAEDQGRENEVEGHIFFGAEKPAEFFERETF